MKEIIELSRCLSELVLEKKIIFWIL